MVNPLATPGHWGQKVYFPKGWGAVAGDGWQSLGEICSAPCGGPCGYYQISRLLESSTVCMEDANLSAHANYLPLCACATDLADIYKVIKVV